MKTQIDVQITEKRSIELPFFARLGTMYLYVAGTKTDGGPFGHTIHTDGSIMLNSSCISDAFHRDAVQITPEQFWTRWSGAVENLKSMERAAQ